MNSSSHPTFPYDSSPFISFSAMEPNGTISTHPTQKYQLLDWEYTTPHGSSPFPNYTNTTTTNHFDNIPLPFYLPQPPPPLVADYPRGGGLFKLEDEDEVEVTNGAFGGLGGDRIGLNLGRRTYFSYYDHQQLLLFGRGVHHQPPRCQAEGCNTDLSGAKHYHRRHKVCDFHSKAAAVFFPGGVQQRFCQQCSRFHRLAEFDGTKRSCRKRLAEHNRRRRKLQPQPSMKNNASPHLSLPPNTMPKERCKLLISPTKATSIMKSNTTGENIPAKMTVETSQYPGSSALSLGGRTGDSTFVSPERFQSQCPSPCSSSNAFFHHHNLGSHSTGGGGSEMTQHNQNSVLQLGQAMFEWDFIRNVYTLQQNCSTAVIFW